MDDALAKSLAPQQVPDIKAQRLVVGFALGALGQNEPAVLDCVMRRPFLIIPAVCRLGEG
ncbi:hypothetical protein [Roseovarius marisflavi]|uniref:hypothetical protein n=1 Tax=Roseovarius marisflavi TaxID=1054996 RepID=UPI0009329644|nr:hypothetical protein [Roseovarius marisflavi]